MFKKEVTVNTPKVGALVVSTGCIDFSKPNALEEMEEMHKQLESGELETTVTITEAKKPFTKETFFKANGQSGTRIEISGAPEASNTNGMK